MTKEIYDSREETLKHIDNVRNKIMKVVSDLVGRAISHDMAKLYPPEKEYYDKYTPMLRTLKYGSDEYKEVLSKMQVALDHHYSSSRHHPEFYVDSIDGMTLIDLLEMLIDWKAAGERHVDKPSNIFESIEYNSHKRFKIGSQLEQILKNTANYLFYDND